MPRFGACLNAYAKQANILETQINDVSLKLAIEARMIPADVEVNRKQNVSTSFIVLLVPLECIVMCREYRWPAMP